MPTLRTAQKLSSSAITTGDALPDSSYSEHTQDIIVSQLEVLLNYAERFYTRQFRTRHNVEADIVTRFEAMLHRHFEQEPDKLIAANDIASELSMSAHYLSDLLRSLTGMNTLQHIHAHVVERAKRDKRLSSSET
ncbi:MAG: helix-turn-helix domain-containing protein [Tannerellaceae bacterium]|jgi:AraC-like DNA-binding protein|nr:helix-turn-helix domain-containing protein [Tannerellaceae bacterium]